MPRPLVVSVLHHSIPPLRNGAIAEEDNLGWHFRSARVLKEYGGFRALAMRPSGSRDMFIKEVDGVPVVLAPTVRLSPWSKVWKWGEYSPRLAKLVRLFVKKYDAIPYIHEYRTLNSEIVMRKILDYSMILQHHGSHPPIREKIFRGDVKELSKLRRERLLKKVKGVIFVVNRTEKKYLEEALGVDAKVKTRTMAVDFNELKPLTAEEKALLRKKLGIHEDSVVLMTYVGVFGEELSPLKGAHLIAKLWKDLQGEYGNKVALIVTGLGMRYVEALRRLGVIAYEFLPHRRFIELLKVADIYFMMATPSYYGGIGVAIIEALALGKPVVSPTLREFPNPKNVKSLGMATPYVDTEEHYQAFLKALNYVITNLEHYNSNIIRDLAYQYYSWESFVKDFSEATSKL